MDERKKGREGCSDTNKEERKERNIMQEGELLNRNERKLTGLMEVTFALCLGKVREVKQHVKVESSPYPHFTCPLALRGRAGGVNSLSTDTMDQGSVLAVMATVA